MVVARINKKTFNLVLADKKVSKAYLIEKIKTATNPNELIGNLADEETDLLPTIRQAKEVAKLLRIPFASLYMAPEKVKPFLHQIPSIQNRLMNKNATKDESLINLAISDVLYSYHFYLKTVEILENDVTNFNVSFNTKKSNDKNEWADKIRNEFDLSLAEQYKLSAPRQFYLYLKNAIENRGIFVQEFSGVNIDLIRAFAIYNKDFRMPIIGINANDRPPAKSFSLIHELVHILKNTSSLCNEMNNIYQKNKEEIFCNAVAGEVLVPENAIKVLLEKRDFNLTSLIDIKKIADKFSISREVISRRLLDLDKISQDDYDIIIATIKREIDKHKQEERIRRKEGRGTKIPKKPDKEAFDKSSVSLSKAIYIGYFGDIFTKRDISQILSIKSKYVDGYLQEVAKWSK